MVEVEEVEECSVDVVWGGELEDVGAEKGVHVRGALEHAVRYQDLCTMVDLYCVK